MRILCIILICSICFVGSLSAQRQNASSYNSSGQSTTSNNSAANTRQNASNSYSPSNYSTPSQTPVAPAGPAPKIVASPPRQNVTALPGRTTNNQRQNASSQGAANRPPAPTAPNAEDVIRSLLPRDRVVINNKQIDRNTVTWQRDVYRIIDIENDKNAAFFYPRETDKHQANLFSILFNLVKDSRVQAFKFNLLNKQGKDDLEGIKFRDMLDLHSIPYTIGAGNTISVSNYDLPTDEIRSFYIREQWVFDERTRKGDVQIVAICPVLHRPESYEFSDSPILKIPLFWVSFNEISHYLARAVNFTAVSDVSKFAPNLSLFDILRNRMYEGKIYQIGDRVLLEYYNNDEELEAEQKRLDDTLNKIMNRFNTIR